MANNKENGYSLRKFWNDATSINALPGRAVKGFISAFRKDPNRDKIDWDKELARRNSKSEWVNFAEDFVDDASSRSVDVLSNFGKGLLDGVGGIGHGALTIGSALSQFLPGKTLQHGAGRLFQKGHNYLADGIQYAKTPLDRVIKADGIDKNNDNEMARSLNGAVRLSGSLLSSWGIGGKAVGALGKLKGLGATATSAKGAAALNKLTQFGATHAPKLFNPANVNRINTVGGKLIKGLSDFAFVNGTPAATGYFTLATTPMISDALNNMVDQKAVNKYWYTRWPKALADGITKVVRKPLLGGKFAIGDVAKLTIPYHVAEVVSPEKWGMAGLQAISPALSDPDKYDAGKWFNPRLDKLPVFRDAVNKVNTKFPNLASDVAYMLSHGNHALPKELEGYLAQGVSTANEKLWELYNDPRTPVTTKLMIESLMFKTDKELNTQRALIMPQLVRALKPTAPMARWNRDRAAEAYDHFKRRAGWR